MQRQRGKIRMFNESAGREYLDVAAEVLGLHVGDEVEAEGRQGAAQGQTQGLAWQPHQHLPHKLGSVGLDGVGHLLLTDQGGPTGSRRTTGAVERLPHTHRAILGQQLLTGAVSS